MKLLKRMMERMRWFSFLVIVVSLFCAGGAGLYAQINFGTTSDVAFGTWFDPETMEVKNAETQLHSYIRFNGSAFKKLNVFTELEAGQTQRLYNKDVLEWGDGFQQFFTDGLTNPFSYFIGLPTIGHFSINIQDPYVTTLFGFKYVKLPRHDNALWMTVDGDWDAGYGGTGGFLLFRPGAKLQKIGDIRFNASIAPNKSADRAGNQYGFLGIVTAQYKTHTLDFQYNGAYGKAGYDTIFDQIYEADYILGYSGKVGPVGIKANGLVNLWGEEKVALMVDGKDYEYKKRYSPPQSDVGAVDPDANALENMAGAVQAIYSINRQVQTLAGYKFRGSQASLMYVKQDGGDEHIQDQLGDRNVQQAYVDVTVKPMNTVTLHAAVGAEFAFIQDGLYKPYPGWDNMRIYVNPSFDLNLSRLIHINNSKVSAYAELNFRTAEEDWVRRGNWESNFFVPKVGLKLEVGALNKLVRGAELICGFDNQAQNYFRHSYIGIVKLPESLNVELGAVVRTPNFGMDESKNPFGFFFGVNKKLKAIGKPIVYGQFLWKANPYKGFTDGQNYLDLDGDLLYDPDRGQSEAAIRTGLRWEL
ncbi:MAG: hypothetical protein LBS97_06420 [Treponema sp.]|nr:hypothetical protein [Treponema sp.]